MPVLAVGETEIPYTLRRSATAKKARITVTPETVEVVVPKATTDAAIDELLHQRRGWVYEQTRQMASRVANTPKVAHFASGAKIPYRGRLMRLTVEPSDGTLVEVTYRNGFIVHCPRTIPEESRDTLIESALRLWLRKRLRQDVTAFVRQHGDPSDLKPKRIAIKDQKHLWGSCGVDRVVNLNWQLIFAPKPVLEYAVVHELCHLRHRNHDREFWGLLGAILPDWEAQKAWLDRNEQLVGMRWVERA